MVDPEPRPPSPAGGDELSGRPTPPIPESLLAGFDPGELLARGMQTVNYTNSGEAWTPPTVEELREALPQFEITELLGQGGMGAVYRGVQRGLQREVAIKLLRPELTEEAVALERFMNEARITAQLDHPNIPAVHVLESDKTRFLSAFAMTMLPGQTLEDVLAANEAKNLDGLAAALEVLLRICDALAFAHSKGVLHLDLKPANVIVGTFGQIYLVDWGVAQRKDRIAMDFASLPAVEGTPAYMAPEQAAGERWTFDERTDTFALGGILYRILCGRSPHEAPTADQALALAADAAVTPPDVVAAKIGRKLPPRLVSICLKALAPEPDLRYQRVEDFQQDLERFARGPAQLPQRAFESGDPIVVEGEAGDTAYVILSGECVATRQIQGQTHELRRIHAGEMFGEAAVFTGRPRSATVSAVSSTVVGIVEKAMLDEEMERTSFMSLAIRTVVTTFLDLDRQLTHQRQRSQVIELALRHMAKHGEKGRVPWKPLLALLAETTEAPEADVASWVLDAPGFALEGESLMLRI